MILPGGFCLIAAVSTIIVDKEEITVCYTCKSKMDRQSELNFEMGLSVTKDLNPERFKHREYTNS